MGKKMIAIDLDGTLLNEKKKVSEYSKNYLKRLKDEGYVIVIATGRMVNTAIYTTDGGEFANYLIADHGSIIYDLDKNEIISRLLIDEEDIKKAYEICIDNAYYISVCDSSFHYRYMPNPVKENKNSFVKILSNKEKFRSKLVNISRMVILIEDDKVAIETAEKLKNTLKSSDVFIMFDSFNQRKKWVEITPRGISKYRSIKKIMSIEDIKSEEIIAFGDSINDIEMISNCGIGVAMGNAISELKIKANYTASSHTADGVVKFLEEFLK